VSLAMPSANAPPQQTEEHHEEISEFSLPVAAALDAAAPAKPAASEQTQRDKR